jgi:hypothetical protein
MKKSTLNIIYLYNNLEQIVNGFYNLSLYDGNTDDYYINIEEDFKSFKVELMHHDEADVFTMYPLSSIKIDVDEETGTVYANPISVSMIIDNWFERNIH